MSNVVALVDEETARGFRMSGIGTRTTDTPEELVAWANALRSDPEVRLVLMDESLFRQLPERVKGRLEDSRAPLFIPIPVLDLSKGAVKPEEYVARLMRRAIGYQIKIRR